MVDDQDRAGDGVEARLRRMLHAEAAAVDPSVAPRVDEVGARRRPARRWTAGLAVAASVALVAAATALALPQEDQVAPPVAPPAVAGPSEVPTPADPPTPTASVAPSPVDPSPVEPAPVEPAPVTAGPPSTGPTPEPTPRPTTTTASPSDGSAADVTVLVWATRPDDDEFASPLVVPERRRTTVPAGDASGATDDEARVSAALDVLLTSEPLDPDYDNPWAYRAEAREPLESIDVSIRPDGTTVDFSGAPAGLDTGYYVGALVEQLVRTVVSNGGTQPVTFLVDGRAQPFVQLDWSEPVRAGGVPLVGGWVLDPWHGQRVAAGPVTVSGTGTAFEANVLWQVTDADGTVVADGFTMAGANGEYGPFSFTVDLDPGRYTVSVREPSMADPDEGPALVWEDTKTIDVVG